MLKLKTNKKSGITLIALVVTIIVLLILAGISIMMLSGNNGILQRSSDAKEETIIGQEKEQVELAYVSAAVKKLGDHVTGEELQHELDLSVGAGKTEVEGQTILDVLFTDTNHSYTVENGKVEKNGPVVNPFDPDEWEFAWVYPTAEGKWSEEITESESLPQNYEIIAKLYEGKESDVRYSLVIEGEGEIKDLFDVPDSAQSDADIIFFAWLTGAGSGNAIFMDERNTVNVIICDGITGIGDSAFTYCLGLKDIKIPNSVTSIGRNAFFRCNFASIKIPNSVISIGELAFCACGSLTDVKMPNRLTSIGKEAFELCISLTSIEIPSSVESIGWRAFADCEYLREIIVRKTENSISGAPWGAIPGTRVTWTGEN